MAHSSRSGFAGEPSRHHRSSQRITGIFVGHAAVASRSLGDFWAAFDDADVTATCADIKGQLQDERINLHSVVRNHWEDPAARVVARRSTRASRLTPRTALPTIILVS